MLFEARSATGRTIAPWPHVFAAAALRESVYAPAAMMQAFMTRCRRDNLSIAQALKIQLLLQYPLADLPIL